MPRYRWPSSIAIARTLERRAVDGRCRTFLEVAMRPASFPANDRIGCCSFQWIGLGENLQENPISNGKNHGFL